MGSLFGRSIVVEGVFARIVDRRLRIVRERALGGTACAVPSPLAGLPEIAYPLHDRMSVDSLAGGISGATNGHSASVKSPG